MSRFPFFAVVSTSLLSSVFAALPESGGMLSSTQAAYDGTALVLTGQVTLDHGLGKMKAEQANLERQEEMGKDFPFRLIHLHNDVIVSLKNNAELLCQHADLDFTSLQGFLTASEGNRVSYIDPDRKKNNRSSLRILSEKIDLTFAKQEEEAKKTEYAIATILAKDNVEITYADHFTLQSDRALYRKQQSPDDKTNAKEFQGVLTAYPQNEETKCHLIHLEDLIDADVVDLDLTRSKISLLHPEGKIASSLLSQGDLRFRCEHLSWDQKKDTLILQGNITLLDSSFGTLSASDTIELTHTQIGENRLLQSIRSQGHTQFVYASDPPHRVTCYGTSLFDRKHSQTILTSPIQDGKVLPEQQIYYESIGASFYADTALIEYTEHEGRLKPISLTLKDNIRLLSQEVEGSPCYALADRLSYSPETQTIILSAAARKQVLFWDEHEGVQMSAREVHIFQDSETGKRSIKGIGNLRLQLDIAEREQFQKIFPQGSFSHE